MTGEEFYAARRALGEMWGLGRPLHAAEMGRLLGLKAQRDPGEQVLKWERTEPTGPASIAVEMMLATGRRPSTFDTAVRGAATKNAPPAGPAGR